MSQNMTFKFNDYGKYLPLNCIIVNDLPIEFRMDLINSQNYISRSRVIAPEFSLFLMS